MKKVLLIAAGLLLATGVVLAVMGNSVREIRTEIEISAPVEKVWGILANVDDWQNWSPIINQSSGTATHGATLNITMMGKEKGQDGPNYSPVITIFDEPKTLRWSAKMIAGFIMTNDKVLELKKTNTGTKLIHKELFSGMLVPIFWSSVEKNVPTMLNSMNEALKAKAEKAGN